jgi:hypothetical protein
VSAVSSEQLEGQEARRRKRVDAEFVVWFRAFQLTSVLASQQFIADCWQLCWRKGMAQHSKRFAKAATTVAEQASQPVDLKTAISVLKSVDSAKFNETMEVAVRLGVDPRKADQMIRGTVVLPHGTGKSVRVLVFAKGEKEKEAQEAGADLVGCEDLMEKIQQGWLEFDRAIATPDGVPGGSCPTPKQGRSPLMSAERSRSLRRAKSSTGWIRPALSMPLLGRSLSRRIN